MYKQYFHAAFYELRNCPEDFEGAAIFTEYVETPLMTVTHQLTMVGGWWKDIQSHIQSGLGSNGPRATEDAISHTHRL
jgi:hypothetical protein